MSVSVSSIFSKVKALLTPANIAIVVKDLKTLPTVLGTVIFDLALVESHIPTDWKLYGYVGSAIGFVTLLARDVAEVVNNLPDFAKK